MREILFRAWDGKRYSIGKPEYFDDSVNFRFHHFDINCEKPILEQFTGLTDKNGKKIFEGDIVKSITYFYGNQKERITVISFEEIENDSFGEPYTIGYAILGSEYEVIGNIYENQELLK